MINNTAIIGRSEEQKLLNEYFVSERSEFIAVYGRRRVGKTFLVREMFGADFLFYVSGILNGKGTEQIANFNKEITKFGGRKLIPANNWSEAFDNLNALIESSAKKGKKVVFLDEVPWMSTPKSGFLSALDYFWNRYISMRKDVLLIICG